MSEINIAEAEKGERSETEVKNEKKGHWLTSSVIPHYHILGMQILFLFYQISRQGLLNKFITAYIANPPCSENQKPNEKEQ